MRFPGSGAALVRGLLNIVGGLAGFFLWLFVATRVIGAEAGLAPIGWIFMTYIVVVVLDGFAAAAVAFTAREHSTGFRLAVVLSAVAAAIVLLGSLGIFGYQDGLFWVLAVWPLGVGILTALAGVFAKDTLLAFAGAAFAAAGAVTTFFPQLLSGIFMWMPLLTVAIGVVWLVWSRKPQLVAISSAH